MRDQDEESIRTALRRAGDVAGVARLLELLGYERADGDAGIALDASGELRHVASGSGIDALCLTRGRENGALSQAARIRSVLGGVPRAVLLLCPFPGALTLASGGLDGRARVRTISRDEPRATEIETLLDLVARNEPVLASLSRHARALDRSALTRRFFREFRAQRDAVSRAWLGPPDRARTDRDQLALLFLSRIVFLYFLQRQGHLLGRDDYLVSMVRAATLEPSADSVFRRVLRPLFFGVLNRPVEDRDADALRLGPLPYLNGGLFEPHALERAHAQLDLPDATVIGVFEGLFERYRFTAAETRSAAADVGGIEPEMLGRMFEGLMAADRRGRTGTFYTPAAVVDRIVRQGLQAWLSGRPGLDWRAAGMLLKERGPAYGSDPALLTDVARLRMIDPACGSGAFVLGALDRLTRLRRRLGDTRDVDTLRRDLAAGALHGVDLEPDAALLCALRLWLALTPGGGMGASVQPLPNLDHRVRQGDALLDPIELAARGDAATAVWRAAALDDAVRRARRVLAGLVRRYCTVSAAERAAIRARIGRAEVRLARRWIHGALRRIEATRRDLHARVRAPDLFGERTASRPALRAQLVQLRDARIELRRLERRMREQDALPFFSFALHFGELDEAGRPGFDLVVSNPPWVRSHRWPRAFSSLIRSRYRVCRDGAWRGAGARAPAGQVDLALLFVERGLDMLRPHGVLALLLPAKAFRSLSAGGARALVRERAAVLSIEDHALHHRAIFRNADAFAGVLVARAHDTGRADGSGVRVTMTHRGSPPLRFRARATDLPLDRGDARSPWLIVPPDVRRALRAMQRAGSTLGADARLSIRRGAMTGANDALLFERAERKLGDAAVAWPARVDGVAPPSSVLLHPTDLCPLVRGAGIRPFAFRSDGFVAWCHDDLTAMPREPSRRLARHLAPARQRLRARPGWRADLPDGVLFRVDAAMLRPRVAWRDIASDLEVTRLPARLDVLGTERPLIALNTVYFIAVDDDCTANALVALLSSLPCRVFARAIAERAKDARFRFFAWTVGAIPLPAAWRHPRERDRLGILAQRVRRAVEPCVVDDAIRLEIDDLAARLYGLAPDHVVALRRFDGWLAGRPTVPDPVPSIPVSQ